MEVNIEQWRSSIVDGLDPFSIIEKDLFTSIDDTIKESKECLEQFHQVKEENPTLYANIIKKFEDQKTKAEDNLISKQNERKVLYQTKLKDLESQKVEEEKRFKKETVVLEDISNKMQQAANRQKQLKEKKRNIKRKELSVRDQQTFELFTQTFQLYWTGDPADRDNDVNGYCKLDSSNVKPFCFKQEEYSRREIIDRLWDMIDS